MNPTKEPMNGISKPPPPFVGEEKAWLPTIARNHKKWVGFACTELIDEQDSLKAEAPVASLKQLIRSKCHPNIA